ncbi:hypothetical protein GIW70_14595 [Pseudomonas syringae]|nr:hypothetical protein [Pseudomonas syringae]MCF5069416.1 hypothetical protein [Pseudomonas syringae]
MNTQRFLRHPEVFMDIKKSPSHAGDRDTTFGTDGEVTLSKLPWPDDLPVRLIKGSLVLPDNKILLSVNLQISDAHTVYGLARFSPTGNLDINFANGGLITDRFPGGESHGGGRLLRLADGRLLMLGVRFTYQGPEPIPHLAMACYSSDYTLDTTFADQGHLVIENKGNELCMPDLSRVVQQSDGKLLVSTTYYDFDHYTQTTGCLLRIELNGRLDLTFNQTGRLDFKVQDPNAATAITACLSQPDGKIVVAGHGFFQPARETAVIARFDSQGILDVSFGRRNSPGYYSVGLEDQVTRFNDLVATSRGFIGIGQAGSQNHPSTLGLLVGITTNGSEDPAFNNGKPHVAKYHPEIDNAWICGLVQTDGKVITSTGRHYIYISRWMDDGSVDDGFGDGGFVSEDTESSQQPIILSARVDNTFMWTGNTTGVGGGSTGKLINYLA